MMASTPTTWQPALCAPAASSLMLIV
jgi:hypothetical protein